MWTSPPKHVDLGQIMRLKGLGFHNFTAFVTMREEYFYSRYAGELTQLDDGTCKFTLYTFEEFAKRFISTTYPKVLG